MITKTDLIAYLEREGIERIYKNNQGFWLFPLLDSGEIFYNSYRSTGPYKTLMAAVEAGRAKGDE